MYGRRFPLRLKGVVHRSYVRLAILYGSDAWVPEGKRDWNFTKDRKIHGESNVWSTAQRSTDLMFMLGLSEAMDQLAMANSVLWYGHVLRRGDGHVLRRALDIEVEHQRKCEEWSEKGR